MRRTAIVTGSDSGIGKATAVHLARAGFDVGVTWHDDEHGARGTVSEVEGVGRRAVMRRLDVSAGPDAVTATVDGIIDDLGGIGVFVNNAGTGSAAPFLETTWEDWRTVLATDLDGAFLCAQAAARRMVAQGEGGRIVNVTSVHEHVPKAGSSAYCAAKGGLGLLTKVMALELAEHGIAVNAVAPGEIATPMTGNEDAEPEAVDRAGFPIGRPGDAHEVAALITHLAADESAFIVGSSFVIDGGLMLLAAQYPRHDASSRQPD